MGYPGAVQTSSAFLGAGESVTRIFGWRDSDVWRSILVGLKRSNTIGKADNEIYLLTIISGFRD